MGKKPRIQEAREQVQIQWYQWEFLRRNPDYHGDYEGFIAEFGSWFRKKGYWYDRSVSYQGKDWEYFCRKICPRARTICRKWQVSDPFPPDWIFDKKSGVHEYKPRHPPSSKSSGLLGRVRRMGRRVESSNKGRPKTRYYKHLPTGVSPELAAACWNPPQDSRRGLVKQARKALESIHSRTPTEEEHYRYVEMRFDLTLPPRELLRKARRAIEIGKPQYEFFLRMRKDAPKKPPQKRRRLDQYDSYLAVWDLRQQGVKPSEIAQKVGQSGQTVYDHYRAAGKLIRGGYKELR